MTTSAPTIESCVLLAKIVVFAWLQLVSTTASDPVYVESTPVNVTKYQGDTATLKCSVIGLETKKIVWRMKGRKASLSIGSSVFISDPRFSIDHEQGGNNWDLVIRDIKRGEDNGTYECQIPTNPPMRRYIHLRIPPRPLLPQPVIKGPEDAVDIGDIVRLQCNATSKTVNDRPPEIEWFLNGNKVTPTGDGEVEVNSEVKGKLTISTLMIKHAKMMNSGTYVCRTSDKKTNSQVVSILDTGTKNEKRGMTYNVGTDDNSAQVGESNSGQRLTTSSLIALSLTFWTIFTIH